MSEVPRPVDTTLSAITVHINAGGRGTRIEPVIPAHLIHPTLGVSKALLSVGTEKTPLIDHHIANLLNIGAGSIVAAVGDHEHVGRRVLQRFADQPRVHAVGTMRQRGTGGDLLDALRTYPEYYAGEVMVKNVDTVLDIDHDEFLDQHRQSGGGLTIALTQNRGVPNQDAFYVAGNSRVLYSAEAAANQIDETTAAQQAAWRGSSTGAIIVDRELLHDMPDDDEPLSLYRDVVGFALGQGALSAYNNHDKFFLDVGTVQTWHQAVSESSVLQSYLET
jgi:NDP-sugar pyrophosphorylase family protein